MSYEGFFPISLYAADSNNTPNLVHGAQGCVGIITYSGYLFGVGANSSGFQVKYGFANVPAGQTDYNLVTAVANNKIRMLQVVAQCGATGTTLVFNTKPAGAGSAISMTMQPGANGGAVRPYSPHGWFETNTGEGLTCTTGAGSTTGIEYAYIEV